MSVSQHLMMADGDVKACVNCGREPWMTAFGETCPGPHPDLVKVLTDHELRPLGWSDLFAAGAVLAVVASSWVAAGAIGWAAWSLVR